MVASLVVETSRGNVALRCWGSGETTVVLLHGLPGSGRSWDRVAALLAPSSRVVVPDLAGFGGSGRPTGIDELHAVGQATAVEEVLAHLGLRRTVVVGHDFGGPVALTLAARRPELVGALGLLATNTFGDTPIPFPLSAVTRRGLGPLAGRILFSGPSLRWMIRQGAGRPRPPIDVQAALGDRTQRRSIRMIFQASLTRLAELYGPIEEGLGRIAVPVFVGWGDRDPFFPVEHGRRTASAIPGARFCVYEGAGHFLAEERPREVAADLAELVASAAARP